ncbi:MAG: hypothetical protein AVDCRST_MAG56-7967 [uncultured Cytophagales bacterium]|uniref:Uncharacterized protein n=1 Tax=uncultured Cytophagales bacterium TaxID=158755 RepID=A0A6J4LWM9_9SPHI|nr:MAG: hypothetical protein AVDCRST_MAG56-7967 [uncultured Cytophagales bacterium]
MAGGSIIGPRPFWFFLGQCQKEQTPLTQHQPFTILSPPILLQTIDITTQHITTHH